MESLIGAWWDEQARWFRDSDQQYDVVDLIRHRFADDRDPNECRHLLKLAWHMIMTYREVSYENLRASVSKEKMFRLNQLFEAIGAKDHTAVDQWIMLTREQLSIIPDNSAVRDHEDWLREQWVNPPPPERMPLVTAQWLARGLETPATLRCASMHGNEHPQEIREEFEAAIGELGSTHNSRDDAVFEIIHEQAQRLLEGESPLQIARYVSRLWTFEDFQASLGQPEHKFWYECWIHEVEPITLNVDRLKAHARTILGTGEAEPIH